MGKRSLEVCTLRLLCTSEEKPKTKGKKEEEKKEADLQTSTSIKSSERKVHPHASKRIEEREKERKKERNTNNPYLAMYVCGLVQSLSLEEWVLFRHTLLFVVSVSSEIV
jgi:hypothetical protein